MREKAISLNDDLLNAIIKAEPNTYNPIKKSIEDNGYYEIGFKGKKPVKIYTLKLAMFFEFFEIPEYNINTTEYFETYCKAYFKGVKYFKKEYIPEKRLTFGNDNEAFEKSLNYDCFEKTDNWYSIKNKIGFIKLRHDVIKKYGYYSGIVSEADRLINDYDNTEIGNVPKPLPKQFENFIIREEVKPFIAEIYDTFKNIESKQMAILIHVLHEDNIIPYVKRSQKTGRKALMKCFNPSINDTAVKAYFDTSGTIGNELRLNGNQHHFVYESEIKDLRNILKKILKINIE
jgi:hypothetical protein